MRSIFALSVAVVFSMSAAASEISIAGKWMRGDGDALVRIAPCGSKICATNLWIGDTSKGEEVGDRLVMSLTADSEVSYSGTAYDPKRKLSYSVVVIARDGGLTTRGCFVGKLICKNVYWKSAK